MHYELAHILLPYILVVGGYDADAESVAECRHAIEVQRSEHEKNRIDWMVSLMDGDSHSGNTTARRREAQAGLISGIHYDNP